MKQIILSILFVLIGCMAAMAGDNIKLQEGSIASLKDDGVASLIIDMTDTQFDNKKPLRDDERFADVDKNLPEYSSEFVREFNENAKKFKMTNDDADAQFQILVKITNLDVFVRVMSFKPGQGIKLWGTVTIKNKVSGENVAVFELDGETNAGFTYNLALEEGFEGIAKFLAKRINKGK